MQKTLETLNHISGLAQSHGESWNLHLPPLQSSLEFQRLSSCADSAAGMSSEAIDINYIIHLVNTFILWILIEHLPWKGHMQEIISYNSLLFLTTALLVFWVVFTFVLLEMRPWRSREVWYLFQGHIENSEDGIHLQWTITPRDLWWIWLQGLLRFFRNIIFFLKS